MLLLFSPILCTTDKISVFYTCMAGAVEGGRKAKGNGWPTFSFSEGWEAKDDGTVSCSYTCVKEISLLPQY